MTNQPLNYSHAKNRGVHPPPSRDSALLGSIVCSIVAIVVAGGAWALLHVADRHGLWPLYGLILFGGMILCLPLLLAAIVLLVVAQRQWVTHPQKAIAAWMLIAAQLAFTLYVATLLL